MATLLTKPIKRETLRLTNCFGKHRGKAIIVELLPGDEIAFRVKGTQLSYSIYLGHCLMLAQIQTVEAMYKQALEQYNADKKAGKKRLRKPKRHTVPFSNMYFKALNKQ